MSEYNIQMNKYNALNAGYDQLYPQPMKHANTHAEDGNDPITPSMIGTYTKTEIDTALQKKADSFSVYTKEESISATTRTALSLAETATPDAALAEIARQLSERITLLWENASPTSDFSAQTLSVNTDGCLGIIVSFVGSSFGFDSVTGSDIVNMTIGTSKMAIWQNSAKIQYQLVDLHRQLEQHNFHYQKNKILLYLIYFYYNNIGYEINSSKIA